MKFTSEDLAKSMGLKVGDRIKIKWAKNIYQYELTSDYRLVDNTGVYISLYYILNDEYEILPRKKKVGDIICRETYCYNCPLKMMDCPDDSNKSLFEKLEIVHKEYNDKEIYDILKARLDKEVEE